jgi:hypothetical protein
MWPVVAGGYGICLSLLFVISNLLRMGISVRIRFGVTRLGVSFRSAAAAFSSGTIVECILVWTICEILEPGSLVTPGG